MFTYRVPSKQAQLPYAIDCRCVQNPRLTASIAKVQNIMHTARL